MKIRRRLADGVYRFTVPSYFFGTAWRVRRRGSSFWRISEDGKGYHVEIRPTLATLEEYVQEVAATRRKTAEAINHEE
jgi:hypothetical protein